MSNDLNQCTFTGRLGADPETKQLGSSTVTNFSIAVGSEWKDKGSGEKKERTEWLNIDAYGPLGENVAKYCNKGSQVLVSGELRIRKTEKDGKTSYWTTIKANTVKFIGGKSESKPNESGPSTDFDSDVPF